MPCPRATARAPPPPPAYAAAPAPRPGLQSAPAARQGGEQAVQSRGQGAAPGRGAMFARVMRPAEVHLPSTGSNTAARRAPASGPQAPALPPYNSNNPPEHHLPFLHDRQARALHSRPKQLLARRPRSHPATPPLPGPCRAVKHANSARMQPQELMLIARVRRGGSPAPQTATRADHA